MNGDIFDNNYSNHIPSKFEVRKLIQGMRLVLLEMSACSEVEVWIHPDFGYGASGTSDGDIPPQSLLQFEMQLVQIGEELDPDIKCKKRETLAIGHDEL